MGLAVIILNWRHEPQTLHCARSVATWTGVKPHLVVVDNESTEESKKALKSALGEDCLICSSTNLGYGGGNNLGLRHVLASHKYILLLNTDTRIAPEDVGRLVKRLDDNPMISILSPIIKEGDAATGRIVGARDIGCHTRTRVVVPVERIKRMPYHPIHEVDFVTGTAFLTRSHVFEEIGLLDEAYFFAGEIADFCKRAKMRGHRIFVDLDVEILHDIGQTPKRIRQTLYRYYNLRNRFLYVRKHYENAISYRFYWVLMGALSLTGALCRGNVESARAILLALLHGKRGRYGNQNANFV
jgi:GT2 family glycosyltransferase